MPEQRNDESKSQATNLGKSAATNPVKNSVTGPAKNPGKTDPFKPAQPKIPGLASAAESAGRRAASGSSGQFVESQRLLFAAAGTFLALVAVGVLIYCGRNVSRKTRVVPMAAAPASAATPFEKVNRPADLPLGPGIVASTTDLTKAWSAKRFLFRSPFDPDPVPAIVVRLPGGQYWGLSLREPFGTCELGYVTDLAKLQSDYGLHAEHPMVVDPCTQTVYDLAQYAPGSPDGALVRGAIVSGGAVRPPLAIEIRVEGKNVRAVRSE